MIIQAASLISPLDILPERISAPCAAIAAAHAEGRITLAGVPLVIFGRPAILHDENIQIGPEELQKWITLFRANAEDSLVEAWPEADNALHADWRRMMARGEGALLATILEQRAAITPPTNNYAIVLSEKETEMHFLVEDPIANLRMAVRVYLVKNQMAWTVIVVPGLPDPYPLSDLIHLLQLEIAANR